MDKTNQVSEKEYIERVALIEKLHDDFHGAISDSTMYIYQIIRMLNEVSAAPVEPARKEGEWITVPSSDLSIGRAYKCSICDKMRYGSYLPPYCQCCGAHMERSGNGEQALQT